MTGWAPLDGITVYHVGDSQWVVLGWREDRPDGIQVYGPFRTQSLAATFGRRYFPRRYKIGAVMSPSHHERLLTAAEEMEEH